MDRTKEDLETKISILSPAVGPGPISTICTVSVWIDRPSRQELNRSDSHCDSLETRVEEKEVPLYDRACICALSSQDSSCSQDQYPCIEPEESTRCFNCGSYSHSLSNCLRPRDTAAINSSRRMLLEKRGSFRSSGTSRYYRCFQGIKFDDLKPGVLGPETRKVLGSGEQDPPRRLHRMQELAYPPGNMEEPENEPSGVEIIDEDTKTVSEDFETSVSPTPAGDELSTGVRNDVEFPGVNNSMLKSTKLWVPQVESRPRQPARGVKRSFEQFSESFSAVNASGPPVFSKVDAGDAYLRYGSFSRGVSTSHNGSCSRNGPNGIESFAGSNAPIVWTSTSCSVDKMVAGPPDYWFRGQVPGGSSFAIDAQGCVNNMFRMPHVQHPASYLSGLSEPSIPQRNISFHHGNQYIQPGMFPVPVIHRPNEAWLNAELALNALRPNHNSSDSRFSGGLGRSH